MRGNDDQQEAVFSYIGLEQRVPKDHPLRAIRAMADQALRELDTEFEQMYARGGRPSIAPEKLIRAQLLQVLYSVRSERQLMEQLDYNLLFRWFVGLNIDDPIWDVTVFTKNRERLIEGEVAERLLLAVVEQARAHQLLSEEHFTVDGTLIQAWASRRSFREKPDPPARGTGTRGRCGAELSGPCGDGEPQRTGGGCDGHSVQYNSGTGGSTGHGGQAEARRAEYAGRRQELSISRSSL
jgi:transposase